MGLILNEVEWVEKVIEDQDLGTSPSKTLSLVAKYYSQSNYPKSDIRRMLEIFLIKCDPNASLIKWSPLLDKITKNCDKTKLIQIFGIEIYKNEMEIISKIKSAPQRRLAFTLLCVSKYWNKVSPLNNDWVNTSDADIMRMANISASAKRQSLLFNELMEMGLIRFSKKVDSLNVQVLFIDESNDDIEINITDFRNLGYQYENHISGGFYICENCGITVKPNQGKDKRGRKPKYCPKCANEIQIKQIVSSVTKRRKLKCS